MNGLTTATRDGTQFKMTNSHDLTQLDPSSFEHMINSLAIKVLGAGHTGFGPGSDGGRDGYFEGQAEYPSKAEQWSGRWYIQSKFHAPHLTHDTQKWLIDQIKSELRAFSDPRRHRTWPDNWIVATNIDPSGHPMTGAFDMARSLVHSARPALAKHFHIWGGQKILDLLNLHPEIARQYGHLLSPGHATTAILDHFTDERATVESIIRSIVIRPFQDEQYTKLEQAGSARDLRPGIHAVFVDLPFRSPHTIGSILKYLHRTSSRNHRTDPVLPNSVDWQNWRRHPSRSRTWLVKGGPGHGKSTIGQFFSQIQRAALILQGNSFRVKPDTKELALEIKNKACNLGVWPKVPRIPIYIELNKYAQWHGKRDQFSPKGILTYLCEQLTRWTEQTVLAGTLKRILPTHGWFFAFDGLDEVPSDSKNDIAQEIVSFVDDVVVSCDADVLTLCTSRPQGYSGQFDGLDAAAPISLMPLTPAQALKCAEPVVRTGRSQEEGDKAMSILSTAIRVSAVEELMKTPLQSHIMAVIVRDGRRPPERKWALFSNFYDVIYRREATKDLLDPELRRLLHEEAPLLRTVHNRVGFALHAHAETSAGAVTSMRRDVFRALVQKAVEDMKDVDPTDIVDAVMTAATNRLVLINTPDSGDQVRFDVRQLQEFFAAEYVYDNATDIEIRKRIEIIAGDAHWVEVTHFLLSALVETRRSSALTIAIDALRSIDSDDDESSRMFKRRMARGALATAKLLKDGVLEQDKRMRNRFELAVSPLTCISDVSILLALRQTPPSSRRWLQDMMTRATLECSPSESVGAVLYLSLELDKDDLRARRIRDHIIGSASDLLSIVASATTQACSEDDSDPDDTISDSSSLGPGSLAFQLALDLLEISDWQFRNYWDALEALRSRDAKRTSGIYESLTSFRQMVLNLGSGNLNDQAIDYEWCRVRVVPFSLPTKNPQLLEIARAAPTSEVGYFAMIASITKFVCEPSREHALSVLLQLNGTWDSLFALPGELRIHSPFANTELTVEDALARIRTMTDEQFARELANQTFLGAEIKPTFAGAEFSESAGSEIALLRLINEQPGLAVATWTNWANADPDQLKTVSIEHFTRLIAGHLDQISYHPGLWGKFIASLGDDAPAWRKSLLEKVRLQDLSSHVSSISRGEAHPFYLILPNEADLLPPLILALTRGPHTINPPSFNPRTLAAQYISSTDQLREIALDTSQRPATRASAIAFEILLSNTANQVITEHEALLSALARESTAYQIVDLIGRCVDILGVADDTSVRRILGSMLDASRPYWDRLVEFNELLARWRERSGSPVMRRVEDLDQEIAMLLHQ
ncbi:NACHT domain-containing NTPase [Sorangium cellulosum]|uniref:NACHT domain-containing protein n=1 Tax=Sorangium cellulosum TaxID=56 RepID=UPI003D9A600F